MKRGAWLAIAIFLLNIPFALAARDSLSHVLFGTGVSDDFLLRMIYFALVFTIFFKLSKEQMFKKDNEKKFAVIISLCFGLIIMWFTPAALLNNFKWLILLVGPFALIYILLGFFFKDKKSDEGKTQFNFVRLILAVVITGLLFLLLSGSPGFSGSVGGSVGVGGTPLFGLAMDEGFQDVRNFVFYEMGPLTMLIIVGLIIFGLMMMFRYLFKGRGAGDGDGTFDWKRWIFILIIILAIMTLLMSLSGAIGGISGVGGIPLPGGSILLYVLAAVAIGFIIYLMAKYGGFGALGRMFAWTWNNIASHGLKWWFTKAVPTLAKWIFYHPFKWFFTSAVPWMWRGVKRMGSGLWGIFTWFRGGRKLYVDIQPRPWKHFVSNVILGLLNRIGAPGGMRLQKYFKENTLVPFVVRVRKAAFWGRGRYRVDADVQVSVNIGDVNGSTTLNESTTSGRLAFSYKAPSAPGALDMNVIATKAGSAQFAKTYKYTVGGAGSRRLPNVSIVPRTTVAPYRRLNNINVGDRVQLHVRINSPLLSLGSALPVDGNGIQLTMSGVPSDQLTPNTNPQDTFNFEKDYVFRPNTTSAGQPITVKVEATHPKFVGTAVGFTTVNVNPFSKSNMRILVAYMPTVVPGGAHSVFAITVVDAATGAGIDGMRVTCKQDGMTDKSDKTTGGGQWLPSPIFGPPSGATPGSVFTIKISAEDPRSTKRYNDVSEGSIDLRVAAPGTPPTGVNYKVIS
jgi:hypothetical protein